MKANMNATIALQGTAAGSQSDGSSLIGRKYLVRDTKYGHPIGEYDNPDEANKAMLARPYSKVSSQPDIAQTPKVRDLARKRLVKTNPDVDAGGVGSGRHKYSVGQRVVRNPSVKQWKDSAHPMNKGVILEQTTGKDNKGKESLAYRFLSDYEAKEAKRKDLDPIWDKNVGKGSRYLEKELVPEKK